MYRRSQASGPVDARVDIDDGGLGRSWDTASRFRLQEAGLAIGAARGDALFRVQVELGLHELTAALSSLSRRLESLEASVTRNGGRLKDSESDEAAKGLARSARCVSQALPGIVSARARRKALHAYFRESDEQNETVAVDAATRALVVEGLAHLAGKYRDQHQSEWIRTTSPSAYRGRDHQSVRADERAENVSEFPPPSPVNVITLRRRFTSRQTAPAHEGSAPSCVDSMDVQVDNQSPFRTLRAGRSQDQDGAELNDFIPNSRMSHDATLTVSPSASFNFDNTDHNGNGLRDTNRSETDSGIQPSAGVDGRRRPSGPLRPAELSYSISGARFSRGAGTNHSSELERVGASTSDGEAELVARVLLDAAGIAAEEEEKRGGPEFADGEGLAAGENGAREERGGSGDGAVEEDTEGVRALAQVPQPSLSSSSVLCSSPPSNHKELTPQLPPRMSPPFRQTSMFARYDDHNRADSDNISNTGKDYNSQVSSLKSLPQRNYASATAPTASAMNFGSSGAGIDAAKDCKTTAAASRSMDNACTSTSVGEQHRGGECPGQEVVRDGLDRAWGRAVDDQKLAIDAQGFLDLGALEEEGTSSSMGSFGEGSATQNARFTARMQSLRKLEQRLKQEEEAAASREAITELRRELQGAASKYSGFFNLESHPLPPMRTSSSVKNSSSARLSAVLSGGASFSRDLPIDDEEFVRTCLSNPDSHPGSEPSLSRLPLFDSELRAAFAAALTTHTSRVGAADVGKAGASATSQSTMGDKAIEGAGSSESEKKLAPPRTPNPPRRNSVRDGSTAGGGLSAAEDTDVAENPLMAVAETGSARIVARGRSLSPSDDILMGSRGGETVALAGKAGYGAPSVVDGGPARVASDEVGGIPDSVEEPKQDLATQREEVGDTCRGIGKQGGGGALAEVAIGVSTEKKGGADGGRSGWDRFAADNNNWAQEYHDYLCNKEKERGAAAVNIRQSLMAAVSTRNFV